MSMPYFGRLFTFTQPDGTALRLRGWGDQHHAVFETEDGYTVTRNPATGFYEVAALSADGRRLVPAPGGPRPPQAAAAGVPRGLRLPREAARAAARASPLMMDTGRRCDERWRERREHLRAIRSAAAAGGPLLAPPERATVGDFVGLCLLIDFSDAPGTIARDEVERFCNQPGYAGFGNRGSVRDFFADNSLGRCRYTNVVTPYYRARRPKTYYTDPTIAQPQRALELIGEALAHWQAQGFDFSPLTADNQGFVYAMNVYYAGPVTNNWAEGLWPHSHHLSSAVPLRPGAKAYDYQFTAMGAELELGTFCHENGHMLCDYPDLYDYGYESSGVGGYCLMCGGNNVDEKNPIPISAYLKRASGWAGTVTPLEHGRVVTLTAGSNDFAIHSRSGREYFLIENRRRAGRDASLPDEGLAIWHVDEDGDNSDEGMTPTKHYELSLEQADGRFDLERQRGQMGDAGDLYAGAAARFADDTVPSSRWWNGSASNLTLDQIGPAGPAVSFRALFGPDTTPPAQPLRVERKAKLAVPDNRSAGVLDAIEIAQAISLGTIEVGVDIRHPFRGDLRVSLTTPWGAVVELHPKGRGGGAHDLRMTYTEANLPALSTLRGRPVQGRWVLQVQDLAPQDSGTLESWWLQFTPGTTTPPATGTVLQESPGQRIPDAPQPGIERTLVSSAAGQVTAVEVSVDITHTWVGDLQLSLAAPNGTSVTLQAGVGGDADNLVRTYTAATTPALAGLVGTTAAGPWVLRVSDAAPQDEGKLNTWKLVIRSA